MKIVLLPGLDGRVEVELSSQQLVQLKDIVDEILNETFHTLFPGLDDGEKIGNVQIL